MNKNLIRPIPKKIQRRILLYDAKYSDNKGLRFYAYLTTMQKELVKITVAVRNKNKKTRLIKQVAIHGVYSDKCLVRDMEYKYIGGYRVGWYKEGIRYVYNIPPFYNDGVWYDVDYKYYNPWAPVINPGFAMKLEEFRYSAADILDPPCIISYLRTYIKYPQTEYLVKAGLGYLAGSKMILEKTGRDKRFCKWLYSKREELKSRRFYIDVILRAYRTGKPLETIQLYREAKLKLRSDSNYTPIRELFPGMERERLFDYLAIHKSNMSEYLDYINACKYLGLDLSLSKNLLPHDFKRWHDIRIDEYASKKALEDEEKRKTLYMQFAAVAEKYMPLQYDKKHTFVCIIAKSPAELILEGEILNHCVGRMNYDQRFIREDSLIFFIRSKLEPDKPFVTMEYSPKSKRILQCYGANNSSPGEDVLHYVHKIWLPYANRKLKHTAA